MWKSVRNYWRETYNGHMVQCDSWMNIHLREVICTSKVRAEGRLQLGQGLCESCPHGVHRTQVCVC